MKYVQLTRRLRVQRGPGHPDLVSERPLKLNARGEFKAYLDDPDSGPTLVEFDELCQVDIPALLRSGALREYAPPKPKRAARKGA